MGLWPKATRTYTDCLAMRCIDFDIDIWLYVTVSFSIYTRSITLRVLAKGYRSASEMCRAEIGILVMPLMPMHRFYLGATSAERWLEPT